MIHKELEKLFRDSGFLFYITELRMMAIERNEDWLPDDFLIVLLQTWIDIAKTKLNTYQNYNDTYSIDECATTKQELELFLKLIPS